MPHSVEPYLGDCVGQPVIYRPMLRPRYVPHWFAPKVHALLSVVGVGLYLLFVIGWLVLVFSLGSKSIGKEVEWREYAVPPACKSLADRYGYSYLLTRDEALAALIKLENNRYWPGVSQCLKAVNKEWRLR